MALITPADWWKSLIFKNSTVRFINWNVGNKSGDRSLTEIIHTLKEKSQKGKTIFALEEILDEKAADKITNGLGEEYTYVMCPADNSNSSGGDKRHEQYVVIFPKKYKATPIGENYHLPLRGAARPPMGVSFSGIGFFKKLPLLVSHASYTNSNKEKKHFFSALSNDIWGKGQYLVATDLNGWPEHLFAKGIESYAGYMNLSLPGYYFGPIGSKKTTKLGESKPLDWFLIPSSLMPVYAGGFVGNFDLSIFKILGNTAGALVNGDFYSNPNRQELLERYSDHLPIGIDLRPWDGYLLPSKTQNLLSKFGLYHENNQIPLYEKVAIYQK